MQRSPCCHHWLICRGVDVSETQMTIFEGGGVAGGIEKRERYRFLRQIWTALPLMPHECRRCRSLLNLPRPRHKGQFATPIPFTALTVSRRSLTGSSPKTLKRTSIQLVLRFDIILHRSFLRLKHLSSITTGILSPSRRLH